MKYDVEMYNDVGELIGGYQGLTQKAAEKTANDLAEKYPQNQVYVTWFRASDYQHGYLNPDGNHDMTGEAY